MAQRRHPARLIELWRYYQAGVVNTLFGYGMYALFVALGAGPFLAQLVAHVLGVTFNYFTYSRHVFRDATATKMSFALAYAANYALGLATLAGLIRYIDSPYIAGLCATILVSLINYGLLRHLVFRGRRA